MPVDTNFLSEFTINIEKLNEMNTRMSSINLDKNKNFIPGQLSNIQWIKEF